MSLRPSRPLAGVTASQLWANSLDAGELIDKLDADNQTALVDLVRGFFSSDGQLIRIVDFRCICILYALGFANNQTLRRF